MKSEFIKQVYSKFIWNIVLVGLLFSLIISIAYYYVIQTQYKEASEEILISNSKKVELLLDNMDSTLFSSFLLPELYKGMHTLTSRALYTDQVILNDISKKYEAACYNILFSNSFNYESLTFFPDGQDKCYTVNRNSQGIKEFKRGDYLKDYNVNTIDQLVLIEEETPPYLKYHVPFTILSSSIEIKDPYSKKTYGILKLDLRLSRVENLLEDTEDSYFTLIARDKTYFDNNQEKYEISATTKIGDSNLVLNIHRKQPSIAVTLFRGLLIIILYTSFTFISNFLFYRKQTKTLVNTINSLILTINEYKRGNFKANALSCDIDYLNACTAALNEMGTSFENLIDSVYKSTISRQKAEFIALQSQINPHFLYNTLNGFLALNRMGEIDKLENGIITLTKLFRYTCSSQEDIELFEEFNFIEQYLILQEQKFQERLKYIINISEEAKNIHIPRLLLQPFVENSIVHGLEPTNKEVTVKLDGYVLDDYLVIEIQDNGIGCTMDEFNIGINDEKHQAIQNIYSRLELFSKGSTIDVDAQKDVGVKIKLKIKLLNGENK